ncbi:hypothetical protein PsYK624_101090 [Phanerochaete sordida]|uniref:Nephrocystin 3-like N-terminal domain-containing protein n=1 Tax=Phanerochaete sordida TaxID=48140 RepID=A0A9P3GGM7_9APHY|nr:hypothetical protein PsYK624_101090 [Phanerochaete sordida]
MSRPRSLKRTADVALDAASDVLKIAQIVAGAVSVPGLGPVAATLSEVIKRVKDVRTNSEAEYAFFEKIAELDEVVTKMVNDARKPPDGGTFVLHERLDRLWRALCKVHETAGELQGGPKRGGSIQRLLHVERNKGTLEKMNKQLADAVTLFSIGTQGAIENAVRRVENMAVNAEERKIIDDIPHADAGYLSVKEIKSGFMQGTRTETFMTLQAWAGRGYPENSPKPLLLLTAAAGLGKSALAHQLCIRLSDPTQLGLNLGASFFFSRGGIDSAHALFSTIARQLALTQPRIRPIILDAARSFLDGGKEQQVRRTFEELLLKPLMKQPNGAVFNETTLVVIDGLDECKDRGLVPELLRCLLDLVRGVPWLRVFLATRPEPHILPVLTSESAAQIVHHRRLDDPQTIDESRQSVGIYLRQTIPEIHPYGDFVRAHPDMLDRLVQRANGLFIYARITVNYLDTIDTRPEEQFALLLSSSGDGLSPLDELYLQVLRAAFPPKNLQGSSARHTRLHNFLTFIALHLEPLPPAAISLLLTLTDDDVLWMAGRLRAVLLIDARGHLVSLHATFDEFLVDIKRCIDPLYHVDPSWGHALLACKCLSASNYDTVTLYLRSQTYSSADGHSSFNSSTMWSWHSYIIDWDRHLHNARSSDELQRHVWGLPQIQHIMARLYAPYMAAEVNTIHKFVLDPKEAAAICREHFNSRFYCELWWRKMAGDYTASRAASVTLAELESKWEHYKANIKSGTKEGIAEYSFSIQAEDVTRYTAILQGFVDTIRDSGTGELWYNLEIGRREWKPI